ncbi:CAP domain-containing protein [Maribacter sp. MAR_2009_72]|uniref:CAP domain-containing protein n=1 Tax=Maribacter sp. MAR_2009_72 TaxID=1250050 RepID=UPI00119A0864|nr:CAP domain-containing protein [Maribacter sp. MAR_2009_72]TVZ15913.1 uncharacterized protein YkwD [Maribacter sp. MAR_2009_72]
MKLSLSTLALFIILMSSCSKYENFAGYEEVNEEPATKVTLVSSDKHNALEAELFDIINTYRVSIGLNEMTFEGTTYYYAGLHTDYMIQKGNTSHAKFGERAEKISKRTGAVYVAENVARNYDTVQEAFEAWIDSPGHRVNIEGDYDYSAISIKENNNGDLYFTQLFFR